METTKQLLERLKRNEKLDSSIMESLHRTGFILARDVTNHQTPIGQREFLFIRFTEKGRKVLES
jgi:hypothetical protein